MEKERKNYRDLYYFLFGRIENALEMLKENRVEDAEKELIQAQRKAEDVVIERDLS